MHLQGAFAGLFFGPKIGNMPRKPRQSVKRYHDRVAGRYDHSYDDAYWRWHDELTWDHLKGFLPKDLAGEVIDLGCGTGKWGLKLLKSGYRVTFLDISHQMVDQARLRAAEMGLMEKAQFLQGDLAELASQPELVGRGFALSTAMGEPIGCTQSALRTLNEIRGILAPDGVLVATFDNKLAALDFYLEKGNLADLEKFLRDGRTHWLTRDVDERFPIKTVAPDELHRLIENAGFRLLDMVGKTVLPMRQYRALLEASADRRAFSRIEKMLWRNPYAIGRCAHLQVAAQAVS